MDINNVLMNNIRPELRKEYVQCPGCGRIVPRQNYCQSCSRYIGG